MPREFIKELRGDKRGEIIDIYTHIDRDELRRAYLSAMPKFDIY
jgi:integrase/recombinase XerD